MFKFYTYYVRDASRTLKRIWFIWRNGLYYETSLEMFRPIHRQLCCKLFFCYLLSLFNPFSQKVLHFSFKEHKKHYMHHPYLPFLRLHYVEFVDFPYQEYLEKLLASCGLKLVDFSYSYSQYTCYFSCPKTYGYIRLHSRNF